MFLESNSCRHTILSINLGQHPRLVHFPYGKGCLSWVLFTFQNSRQGWRTQWGLVVMVDMTKVFTVPCEEARSNSTTPNTAHICTRTCSSCLAQPDASPSQLPPNIHAEGKHLRAPGLGRCVLGRPGHWRHPTAVLWGPLARLSSFGRLPAGWVRRPPPWSRMREFPKACISLSRKPILLSFLQSTAGLDLTSFSGCPT